MAPIRMLDGTYCYTGADCRKHTDAIRETVICRKERKQMTKEEKLFIARRQFDTKRNPNSFEETPAGDKDTWWQCPVAEDHHWQTPKNKRTSRGDGCPFCSGHRPSSTNNLEDHAPTIAAELIWAPDGKTARDLTTNSNEMCRWKCSKCGHEYPATPNTRSRSGCNNCRERSGGFVLTFANSIAGRYPHLVVDFDVEANGCTADQISAGYHHTCAWHCHVCGHKWWTYPRNRGERGDRCPACAGKVPKPGESLLDLHPVIAKELDETASGLKAADLKPGSGKIGIWNCSVDPTHAPWPAPVRSRTGHNQFKTQFGCPSCTRAHTSHIEQNFRTALADHLQNMLPGHIRLPIPWRQNSNMAVDIIGEYKDSPVAIEYDSHYYHHEAEDIERDLAKTEALLAAGYKVIRVREGKLKPLKLAHKNFLQLGFSYSTNNATIAETVSKSVLWLDL